MGVVTPPLHLGRLLTSPPLQVSLVEGQRGLSIVAARSLKRGLIHEYSGPPCLAFVCLPGSEAAAAAPSGEPPRSHVHVRQRLGPRAQPL